MRRASISLIIFFESARTAAGSALAGAAGAGCELVGDAVVEVEVPLPEHPRVIAESRKRPKNTAAIKAKPEVFFGLAPHCGHASAVVLICALHSLQVVIAIQFPPNY
ncbi:hypothetical protein D3C76_1297460 [compost metagenome]